MTAGTMKLVDLNRSSQSAIDGSGSPEWRLVILAARVGLSRRERELMTHLLDGPLNWDAVVHRATWHRLAGLLFMHLQEQALLASVPDSAVNALRDEQLRTTVSHMYFRRELVQIVDQLHEQRIPVALLKGAALAESVYPTAGIRPMGDLDLLVPAHLAEDAQATIQELGYRPGGTPEDQADTEKNHRHLPALFGIGKPVVVEVHRHIVRLDSPLQFDISGFWDRTEPLVVDGRDFVKTLAPDDMVFHLALNFFLDRRFHSLAALGQLCDLSEVVKQRDELPWERLVSNVKDCGLGGPTASTLALARDLLDAPVPERVIEDLYPAGVDRERLAAFADERVASTRSWLARELVGAGHTYSKSSMVGGMLKRLVPSRRYMISRYGAQARGWAGLRVYAKRWGEGIAYALGAARKPTEFQADLATDRWLHSLTFKSSDETKPTGRLRGQGHYG